MPKWTAPSVARTLARDVLGDRFTVRGATCSLDGPITSVLIVKRTTGSVLEPGRGPVEFPAVTITLDVSVDFPDKAIDRFAQFGFWVLLRTSLHVDDKGRPEHSEYRINDRDHTLPDEISQDVRKALRLLTVSPSELVDLMSISEDRITFGEMNLTVYSRNTQSRIIKAYLMARKLGLHDASQRIVDTFRKTAEKQRLKEERLETLADYSLAGFDVSELKSALSGT
ncbi:hypothetical protein ACWGDE_21170 [Streptomyces sp. NPDC054956]